MNRETHDRIVGLYWDIRERAQDDPEYIRLRQIMEELEEKYEAAVSNLPTEQREAVELYIAGRESMERRLLEIACTEVVHLK